MNKEEEEEKFDPNEMQRVVEDLQRRGLMPDPETFSEVMSEARREYRRELSKLRRQNKPKIF